MNRKLIQKAIEANNIEWRKHSLERMLQRGISRRSVKEALLKGELIEYYENDKPFESGLFFYKANKPLHVVASLDTIEVKVYVITAYIPDSKHFLKDFKTRINNEKQQ